MLPNNPPWYGSSNDQDCPPIPEDPGTPDSAGNVIEDDSVASPATASSALSASSSSSMSSDGFQLENDQVYTTLCRLIQDRRVGFLRNFLDKGVDVNMADDFGNSLLHQAALLGSLDCLKLLLNRGAQVDALSEACATPLHLAALYNHADCAALLISRGASTKSLFGINDNQVRVQDDYLLWQLKKSFVLLSSYTSYTSYTSTSSSRRTFSTRAQKGKYMPHYPLRTGHGGIAHTVSAKPSSLHRSLLRYKGLGPAILAKVDKHKRPSELPAFTPSPPQNIATVFRPFTRPQVVPTTPGDNSVVPVPGDSRTWSRICRYRVSIPRANIPAPAVSAAAAPVPLSLSNNPSVAEKAALESNVQASPVTAAAAPAAAPSSGMPRTVVFVLPQSISRERLNAIMPSGASIAPGQRLAVRLPFCLIEPFIPSEYKAKSIDEQRSGLPVLLRQLAGTILVSVFHL